MPRAVPSPLLSPSPSASVLLLALLLAGCAGDGVPVGGTAASLGPDAIASLPEGVWTTRLRPAGIEAVVSNGTDRFAVVCDATGSGPRAVFRFEPGPATRAEDELRVEAVSRAGTVARTLAFERTSRDGAPVLVHATRPGAETAGLIDALARGSSLTVGPARFSLNGSREALTTALVPGGCHSF